MYDDKPKCPTCKSEAYCCNHPHTDGPGPRLHCTSASMHNFKWEDGKGWVPA